MSTESRQDLRARLEAMPPARWRQIDALFDAVLELPPEDRAAFLDAHTADDPSLRQELEALLAAFDEADAFLEQPAGAPAPTVEPTLEGRRVGPYRIVRQIGQGGMGTVYLAEREDVQKQVALKLVRAGLSSPDHVQRFLVERRVLARLEHPNIARLLDAGVAEDERPFFALEYVEGRPIDAYCDDRRLPVERRLALFQTVCGAVQYAHRNLVVHRDLKPSNILVTDAGEVRLLDFGIAKLLEDEPEEALTRTGARLMTPAYASPEQIRGEPVTTASDVYALGVLLYELLTGRRPFDEIETSELERAFAGGEPKKPSTAVGEAARRGGEDATTATAARATTAERLRRRLSGDLDAICLKALRDDATRRYQSAEQLLEDLRRHLGGLPVLARKDTTGYRLRKFVRRHRVGVAAAAVVLLALVGGIVATTWQARIAEAERQKAEQVAAILPELFWNLEPGELQNAAVTPEEMLDRGLEQIDAQLAEQPEIQARVLTLATDLYMRLAAYDKAEQAARRALSLRHQRYGTEHENVAASMAMLAQSLDKQGRYGEAEPLHRQALAMRRALLGDDHLDVATSLHNYALLLEMQGRHDEAAARYREALALRQKLGAPPRDLAYTQTNLAVILNYQGHYEEAVPLAREALALRKKELGAMHPDVANSLSNLAAILQASGSNEDLEPLYQEALAILRKTHDAGHPFVAYTLNSLAFYLRNKGAYAEAEAHYREALAILRKAHGAEHDWVATVLHNLAQVQADQGRAAEAGGLYREAIAMQARLLGQEHPALAASLYSLGELLLAEGRPDTAEAYLQQALAIRKAALPEGHAATAQTMSLLGACLAARARYDEAEPLLVDGYEGLQRRLGPTHERTQAALRRLVDFLEGRGRTREAAPYRSLLVTGEGSP